ncbi:MAG: glycosyl transferase family protein, partial [Gammaproteobacteria bacterium]|nr:glycosyl transferase family protein [Gammaproteobacteria bacterium]
VQLGAFLMLLRVKEENPQELAGFVQAARDTVAGIEMDRSALVDWPTYAGKRRRLPWFILAALLLAENGIAVLMHGTVGVKDDRLYAEPALAALGLSNTPSLQAAAEMLATSGFAFIRLEDFHDKLKEMMNLRSYFGLRSPINTLLRSLNPLAAPFMVQGTFHPGYRQIHQQAMALLNQPHMAVIKGEGGEAERDPDNACQVFSLHQGKAVDEAWPALFKQRHLKEPLLNVERLVAVWRGEEEDEYATAAVVSSAAIVLRMMARAADVDTATAQAAAMWRHRPKSKYPLQR